MKYTTNKERQEVGYRNFLEVHLKETSRNKSKKSTIKLYVIIVLFAALMFLYESTRWLGITVVVLSILLPVVYKIIMEVSKKKSKNITLPETFDRVEHVFGDTYEVKTYYEGGSENNVKYEYEEIFKVIESEEFFYIYFNAYSAMPLDKQSIEDLNEFKNFIKSKNTIIREM